MIHNFFFRFFLNLETLVGCVLSGPTSPLAFSDSVLNVINQNAKQLENKEHLWRMWSIIVTPLTELINQVWYKSATYFPPTLRNIFLLLLVRAHGGMNRTLNRRCYIFFPVELLNFLFFRLVEFFSFAFPPYSKKYNLMGTKQVRFLQ